MLQFLVFNGALKYKDIAINFLSEKLLLKYCGHLSYYLLYFVFMLRYHLGKFYVFNSHNRDAKGKMTLNGTSVLMQAYTLKCITYYIGSAHKSTLFHNLYTKTTDQFDFMEYQKLL